jgi:hypothetical protein
LVFPMKWWKESVRWIGGESIASSGLSLSVPFLAILFVLFMILNRRSLLQETPTVTVGEFRSVPSGSGASSQADATLVGNTIAKRISQCAHSPRLLTAIPGTPAEFDFLEDSLPRGTWIAFVASLLRALVPKRCWEVTGTLIEVEQGQKAGWIITATVTDQVTHRAILTLRRSGPDACSVAEEVAYIIAADALSSSTAASQWSSWNQSDGSGLKLYQEGQRELRKDAKIASQPDSTVSTGSQGQSAEGEQSLAEQSLAKAALLEPGNLLVRMELAKTRELRKKTLLDALELYLRTIVDFPAGLQSYYRAAVAFEAFSLSKLDRCPARNETQCHRFDRLWARVEGEYLKPRWERPCVNGKVQRDREDKENCMYHQRAHDIASSLFNHADKQLAPGRRLFRSVCPRQHSSILVPTGVRARQFRRAIRVSICCLEVANPDNPLTPEKLSVLKARVGKLTRNPGLPVAIMRPSERVQPGARSRLIGRWVRLTRLVNVSPVGWQAHYNAACFYSLLLGRIQGESDGSIEEELTNRLAWTALEYLRCAVYESAGTLPLAAPWLLKEDPDLEAVRKYRAPRGTELGNYWETWVSWMTSKIDELDNPLSRPSPVPPGYSS